LPLPSSDLPSASRVPPPTSRLKAFLNSKCGNAEKAREALTKAGFDLDEVDPKDLESRIKQAIDAGTKRVVVAGGDGTIATAAALVAKTGIELAILPGGTLNHFAKDHNIPTDLDEAARIASEGIVVGADIAYVNGCVFLNTSSIGAYVTFVRDRERFEKHVGYTLASVGAFFKTLHQIRTFTVTLENESGKRSYRASLVFIGVGERELKMPVLGSRVKNGKRGLHVMVIRGRARARLFNVGLAAIAKGTKEAGKLPEFNDFVVTGGRIDLNRPGTMLGLDGELKRLNTPLDYRIERDALRLVVAPPEKGDS